MNCYGPSRLYDPRDFVDEGYSESECEVMGAELSPPSGIVDMRRLQTAAGDSLWGSTVLINLPAAVAPFTQWYTLVRVNLPDNMSSLFSVIFDDDSANSELNIRQMQVFFGTEGHQAHSGIMAFPRNRILSFPGSLIRVDVRIHGGAAGPSTYKFGAHVSQYPARGGNYSDTRGTGLVAAGGFWLTQVPRFATRIITTPNPLGGGFEPYKINFKNYQSGAPQTVAIVQPTPNVAADYLLPSEVSEITIDNIGVGASQWAVSFVYDF